MSIRLSIAKEPAEIDGVFKLRHDVFCEEEGIFKPTPDKRIIDRFDAFSTTRNVIASSQGQLVGSMRVTLDSSVGLPADDYYDFRRFLPDDARPMHSGMYCVRSAVRMPSIARGIIMMATYYALSNRVTHVLSPIHPPIINLVKRVGFKQLDDPQHDPHTGVTFIPTILDVTKLQDVFVRFAEQNKLYNFLESYECMLYQQGEVVINAGDVGDFAFVIIEGEVEVRSPGSDQLLGVLGPGEVFGELALLTDDIRHANVIAKTDLRTMVLQKDDFLKHLRGRPDDAVEMLKVIGGRMKQMLMKTNPAS